MQGCSRKVPCIVYKKNNIDWDAFRQNPKSLYTVLNVKRSVLNNHVEDFDQFLYDFYKIEVYKDKFGVTHINPPRKKYNYDQFRSSTHYIVDKRGDIKRVQKESLSDMYGPAKEPKVEKEDEIILYSKYTEDKFKAIAKRFDAGWEKIEKRIFPFIPTQIMKQVDVDILDAVIETAEEYIAEYEAYAEREGHDDEVLERNRAKYEEIKDKISAEGSLTKLRKTAEEYLERSERKEADTDINDNPEVLEDHEEDVAFEDTDMDELYKKGKGDKSDLDPNDIKQGQVGDCYFLSSVAAVARNSPDDLKKLIEDNGDGSYTVTLYLRDDRDSKKRTPKKIKVTPDVAKDKNGKIVYAGKGDNELWVMILEKAYAQAMGGFENINFGFGTEAMAALTNKVPKTYHFDDEDLSEKELMKKLKYSIKNKQAVTISSNGKGEQKVYLDEDDEEKGFVVTGHLYALEKVKGDKVYLQNPWGKDHLKLSLEQLKEFFGYCIILE